MMQNCRGFTYFGVVFLIFLVGLGLLEASTVYSIQVQRQKEKELLFIGREYINAISSYYQSSPEGSNTYPKEIQDLLEDKRGIVIKRHLRKPYKDPISRSELGLVMTPDQRIIGIFSRSRQRPIKTANFGELDSLLSNKFTYSEWKFTYKAPEKSSTKDSVGSQSNNIDDNQDMNEAIQENIQTE